MARIVRKYGGASLREPEQIRGVARRIADLAWQGNEVVVVVSAMAKTTDELLELARGLHADPPRREMDMLLSVGERISCALLAMAIEAEGVGAVSYTGSQVGIITDTRHGEARIVEVRPNRLLAALEEKKVVVVAGFQGVSTAKEITTLGRGGSDATAVALAAAVGAERCELMKDVAGLYTADPGVVEEAELVEKVDYEAALRLAQGGARALQSEAARLAKDHAVPLAIGQSSTDQLGTIVTDSPLDRGDVVGIACQPSIVKAQGTGDMPPARGARRSFEHRGRWVTWSEAGPGVEGDLAGITIVTGGRCLEDLQGEVDRVLGEAGVDVAGRQEAPAELWICVPGERADETVRLLHTAFREKGWLRAPEGDRK